MNLEQFELKFNKFEEIYNNVYINFFFDKDIYNILNQCEIIIDKIEKNLDNIKMDNINFLNDDINNIFIKKAKIILPIILSLFFKLDEKEIKYLFYLYYLSSINSYSKNKNKILDINLDYFEIIFPNNFLEINIENTKILQKIFRENKNVNLDNINIDINNYKKLIIDKQSKIKDLEIENNYINIKKLELDNNIKKKTTTNKIILKENIDNSILSNLYIKKKKLLDIKNKKIKKYELLNNNQFIGEKQEKYIKDIEQRLEIISNKINFERLKLNVNKEINTNNFRNIDINKKSNLIYDKIKLNVKDNNIKISKLNTELNDYNKIKNTLKKYNYILKKIKEDKIKFINYIDETYNFNINIQNNCTFLDFYKRYSKDIYTFYLIFKNLNFNVRNIKNMKKILINQKLQFSHILKYLNINDIKSPYILNDINNKYMNKFLYLMYEENINKIKNDYILIKKYYQI